MKKFLVAVSLVFVAMTANAQLYLGGSLSFDVTADKDNNGNDLNTITSFGLSPEIGYYITDRFDIGIDLNISSLSNKDHPSNTKTTTTAWGIAPYARYSFFQFGNFEVIGKGSVFVAGGKRKVGSNETKLMTFGLNVTPIIAYNLTSNIALFTELDFVSFGFDRTKVKDGDAATHFGFGFDADDLTTLGGISVGFIYKF